jgi:thioredoxin 1
MEQLTTEQLKEKINNKESFLLDLYATWCGPCKVLLSSLEKITSENETKIPVYKYDIDTDHDFVRTEMGIRAVPTLKLFKDGVVDMTRTGVVPTPELTEILMN